MTSQRHHHVHDHGHVVQFYSDDHFLLDALGQYVGTALAAGGSAVVITTKAHRDGLKQRLQERGFDTVVAGEQGRYVALDAADTLATFFNDRLDEGRFAEVMGSVLAQVARAAESSHMPVAAFGEMVALFV